MRNVVYKDKAFKRQFFGVDFLVLSMGSNTMVTKMLYKDKDRVPFHSHESEQSGYVISGKYKLIFENEEHYLQKGDSYSILSNVEHSIEIIEEGEVIDIFSPIREDYI